MSSNFEKVEQFNLNFGIPVFHTPQHDIITRDPKPIKYRLDLITEEVDELKTAITTNNFTEVVDALSDILYVVYGFGCSIGVNLDKAFHIVHQSNMSKMCDTEDEAKTTVESYKNSYSGGITPYDSPNYRKSFDDKKFVVYNESTKKILKNVNYKPADFKELLNEKYSVVKFVGKDWKINIDGNVRYKVYNSQPNYYKIDYGGWDIKVIDENNEYFIATHAEFGTVTGNFNIKILATDELAYLHFMKYNYKFSILVNRENETEEVEKKLQELWNNNKLVLQKAQIKVTEWIQNNDVEEVLDLSCLELTCLPDLPDNVKFLDCSHNNLNAIPILPKNLLELDLYDNQITELPPLPNSLQKLDCDNNQITNLSDLPNLLNLSCDGNPLIIKKLPNNLQYLTCELGQLIGFDNLPDTLRYFHCRLDPALRPEFSTRLLLGKNTRCYTATDLKGNTNNYITFNLNDTVIENKEEPSLNIKNKEQSDSKETITLTPLAPPNTRYPEIYTLDPDEVSDNIKEYNIEQGKTYSKTHPDGWTISAELKHDYLVWIEKFVASHSNYGTITGDLRNYKISYETKEGYDDFISKHPLIIIDLGDI